MATQQEMNAMFRHVFPQSQNPPWIDMTPLKPADPVSTLMISVGRPNCGWLRKLLWEQQQLGRIQSYAESTGWLWRSFAIVGKKSALQAIYEHLRKVMPEERE